MNAQRCKENYCTAKKTKIEKKRERDEKSNLEMRYKFYGGQFREHRKKLIVIKIYKGKAKNPNK